MRTPRRGYSSKMGDYGNMNRAILISIREYNSCLRGVYYFPVVIVKIYITK